MTESKKEIAVKVEHVSKSFKLPTEATKSFRTSLVNRFRGIKGFTEQKVLKDINFDVYKGDFFGIVGRNGSGKSTLLKIISQIYVPEKGNVSVVGKMVSFIELGVGFNPELTGRDNVYMNGAMLGFTKEEVDGMYADIVDFSELHDFMNQKLKNYSSGMQVRLAFSVAIKAQGDVLILDEVLAVGDEAFQRKCNDYFMERKASGKTTILVTHDMGAVKKYCNRAVLIEDGLVKAYGEPFDVANQYSVDNTDSNQNSKGNQDKPAFADLVSDLEVNLLSKTLQSPQEPVEFEVTYNLLQDEKTYISFSLTDVDRNIWVYNDNSKDYPTSKKGKQRVVYSCSLNKLNDIKLKLEVTVRDHDGQMLLFSEAHQIPIIMLRRDDISPDNLSGLDAASGLYQRSGQWTFK